MERKNIRRFLSGNPSEFKIIGFLVGKPELNVLTGEEILSMECRIGNKEKPLDITPFLENVKVV